MKEVLVTGAAGFIGSHLCEALLKNGQSVIGVDSFDPFYDRSFKEENLRSCSKFEKFQFHEMDVADKELKFLLSNVSTVIHLAASAGVRPSILNPKAYIDNNVMATQAMTETMLAAGVKRLIFGSSSSIYGNCKEAPFREDTVVEELISPYAATKRSTELLNHVNHHLFDLDVINLRFFTVYGPRQRPDLAIHKFFKATYSGEKISLYGDGSSSRDYTYIGDIVKGIVSALGYIESNTPVFETCNIGSNSPIKLADLVEKIFIVAKMRTEVEFGPKQPGDVDDTYADISRAKRLFNYTPETGMKEGLTLFNDWYKCALV